ncbi:MAG: DUF2318 domain-containing protein [Bifidobacteriaceae bacterium]|jgi:uncharacterized membrane protein|nr:DUF2318 domain-containing protein [Bifidobacteriaceae bacterium]
MLGQLVAVTGGLGPAIFIVAVILVAARIRGSSRRQGAVLAVAIAAGAVAGIALAVIRELTGMAQREVISIWTLGAALVATAGLLVAAWLPDGRAAGSVGLPHKTSRTQRLQRAERTERTERTGAGRRTQPNNHPGISGVIWTSAAAATAALTMFRAIPAVFLQLSSFVVPGTSAVSTDSLLRMLGFAGGAGLLAAVAVFLVRASDGAPRLAGRLALTIAGGTSLLVNLVALAQLLIGRRLVEPPRAVFKAVAWGINHQSWSLWVLAAAALIPPLVTLRANRHPAVGGPNPAVDRLAKARAWRRLRYGLASAGAYLVIGWVVTFGVAIEQREPELSPPEQYELVDGTAVIDLAAIEDGHLHRFAYTTSSGVEVRFIVIKKNGVAYGVGLDACEVCGPTGYYEKDGKIICRLCDVIMNVATIGFKGGCNPIPLDYTLDGGQMLVQTADLEAASGVFA